MKPLLLLTSSALTILAVLPYLRDILRGKTKPNLTSWITWSILTAIATFAAIDAGEYATAIFTAAATTSVLLVVIFGIWKKAYVKYTPLDITCQLIALMGIVLWQMLDSPEIAMLMAIAIEMVGITPTIRHAWKQPNEETWQTFAISGTASILAVLAIESYNWVSLPYPLYLVLANYLVALIIIVRTKHVSTLST